MTPISIPDFSLTEAEAFNVLQTQIIQVTTLTEPIHNRVQYRYVHLGYVCNSTDMPTSESTNCLGSCTKANSNKSTDISGPIKSLFPPLVMTLRNRTLESLIVEKTSRTHLVLLLFVANSPNPLSVKLLGKLFAESFLSMRAFNLCPDFLLPAPPKP